jgi:putative BNR repeat neuraminidase
VRPQGTRTRALRAVAIALGALAAAAIPAAVGAQPGGGSSPSLTRVSGPVGGWCWFADPRAVYANGRTFAGWVDARGYVVVGTLRNGKASRTRIGHPAPPGLVDDHDNPGLLVEKSGRITAFYSHHNGKAMYRRTTEHPYDTTTWRAERTLPTRTGQNTYANPVRLSSESKTYLFWRGNAQPWYSVRDAKGHWATARQLISYPDDNPYTKVASNDRDTIGFAFTDGHPRDVETSLYYAQYRGGRITGADGHPIVALKDAPFTPAQADKVYDAKAHGDRHAWTHDVALTHSGRPAITYATFTADGRSHRYEYARFDGHRWRTHKIVDAGGTITVDDVERWYSGGVVLDHRDPRIVYASVQRGDQHEIERFVTHDGGKSFERTAITSGSPTQNVRPFVPRGLPKDTHELLWMRGFYNRFGNFKTAIVAASLPTP